MDEVVERRPWGKIALVTVPLIEILGSASGFLSNSGFGNRWFDALVKPSFMPPGAAFGIVWPILYALLGVALAMILAEPPSPRRRLGLSLFFVQLALNFAWSPLFFAAHDISLAKGVIFVMAAIAAAAAGQFLRIRQIAGLLMIPYLAWLVFASTLNTVIDSLNPGAGPRCSADRSEIFGDIRCRQGGESAARTLFRQRKGGTPDAIRKPDVRRSRQDDEWHGRDLRRHGARGRNVCAREDARMDGGRRFRRSRRV